MEYVLAVCKISKPIELSVFASDSGARKSGFPEYGAPQKLSSRFPTVRSADTVLPEERHRNAAQLLLDIPHTCPSFLCAQYPLFFAACQPERRIFS